MSDEWTDRNGQWLSRPLPREGDAPARTTIAPPAPAPSAVRRAVVVEDNEDNLVLLAAMLRPHFEVVPCTEPELALSVIAEAAPDIVLLDIGLPTLRGPTILDLVRRLPTTASIPIVAVSADVRRESEEYWTWRGFDAFVAKPIVDRAGLLDTLRTTILRVQARART